MHRARSFPELLYLAACHREVREQLAAADRPDLAAPAESRSRTVLEEFLDRARER